ETRPAPLPREVSRAPLGVAVDLLDVLGQGPQRVVEERRGQSGGGPLRMYVWVDELLGVPRAAAAQETDDPVLPPAGVPDDAVEENVVAAGVIVIGGGTPLEQVRDLPGQGWRHALVRVHDQDPGVRRVVDRPVALRPVA